VIWWEFGVHVIWWWNLRLHVIIFVQREAEIVGLHCALLLVPRYLTYSDNESYLS